MAFDGRVAEQFKLDTGTWVSAGTLRSQVVAAASPYLRDAVICGLNESFIAILAWPNIEACSTLLNLGPSMSLDERAQTIVSSPRVNDEVANALVRHNREHPSSSTRIERFLLMSEPPSVEGHELTEKGYINQRATLERRAHLVDLLYERDLARQADDSGPVTHVR